MPFFTFSQKALDLADLALLDPSVVTHVEPLPIPCGFAQTYNPTWTYFEGKIIAAVRGDNYAVTPNSTTLGIWEKPETPHWLKLPQILPEDPRLIVLQDSLWLIFVARAKYAHMKLFICPLEKRLGRWNIACDPIELCWPKSPKSRVEKNWMPIVKHGELFFIYSLSPYILLKANVQTGECVQIDVPSPRFSWNFGELRGSAQMLPHEDGGYVGVFHSSKQTAPYLFRPRTKVYYFLGGLKIDANLYLTHISQKAYFIPGFYPRGEGGRVVFPCGMLDNGDHYRLCAGRNDHDSIALMLDKKAFMENLQRLSTLNKSILNQENLSRGATAIEN